MTVLLNDKIIFIITFLLQFSLEASNNNPAIQKSEFEYDEDPNVLLRLYQAGESKDPDINLDFEEVLNNPKQRIRVREGALNKVSKTLRIPKPLDEDYYYEDEQPEAESEHEEKKRPLSRWITITLPTILDHQKTMMMMIIVTMTTKMLRLIGKLLLYPL
ncbi:uncharacterized protein [Onthophagus taurus]|uniref:uncharacterized protein isoform X3 n=1 Tax=Onthophagus taurus TaxID=166361 RepID=UPI0039BE25BA